MMKASRFALGLLAVALLALPGTAQTAQPGTQADDQAAAAKSANPDERFVMEAAMGGMMEVQLGKLAVEKAANADVKQFGQRMVDDHGKANEELTQLASQKNVTLPTALDAKHQKMVDRLSALTGEEFDREYMAMMVKDHNEDVRAFERESRNGKDTEVKAWATKTLPTLKQHQNLARVVAGRVGAKGGVKAST